MNNHYANPKALGFAAIAITAWMYGMVYAGWFAESALASNTGSAIMSFAALALLIAALVEFLRGGTWHAVFFMLLSAYAWGVAGSAGVPVTGEVSQAFEGWWDFTWALVLFFLWVAVFKTRAGSAVMLLSLGLWLLFLAAAVARWTGSEGFFILAGYLALITGVISFYATAGEIINTSYGRQVLPLVSGEGGSSTRQGAP